MTRVHILESENVFDEMFSIAHLYNSASSYTAKPIHIQPIFMSIIFHHYKQLARLSREIEEVKRMNDNSTICRN